MWMNALVQRKLVQMANVLTQLVHSRVFVMRASLLMETNVKVSIPRFSYNLYLISFLLNFILQLSKSSPLKNSLILSFNPIQKIISNMRTHYHHHRHHNHNHHHRFMIYIQTTFTVLFVRQKQVL